MKYMATLCLFREEKRGKEEKLNSDETKIKLLKSH